MQSLQEFYQDHKYNKDFDYKLYSLSIPGIHEFYQPYATEIGFTQESVAYYHFVNYFLHQNHNKSIIYIAKSDANTNQLLFFDNNISIINEKQWDMLTQHEIVEVSPAPRKLTKKFNLQPQDYMSAFIGNGSNLKGICYNGVEYNKIYTITQPHQYSKSLNNMLESLVRVTDTENIQVEVYHHHACHKEFISTKKEEITNILITSPFQDMPNIAYLKSVITSIKMFDLFSSTNTIIVADGIKEGSVWDTEQNKQRYKNYINQLKKLIYNKKYPFDKVILLESDGWNGPTRNIQAGLDMVKTPYSFINQHDVMLYDPAHMLWNLNIEDYQEKLKDGFDALRSKNDVKCMIYPRMWEIKPREEFVYNNKIIRPKFSREPNDDEREYYSKNRIDHPSEEIIKERNTWYKYTGKDFIGNNLKLYNIQGFSDAPLLCETHFLQYVLMDYARSHNPDRFLEDQIHSQLLEGLLPDISKHIFLFPLFCANHIDLQSKSKYIGQGTDEY